MSSMSTEEPKTLTHFSQVLEFALRREEEAAGFYRDLRELASFGAQKMALKEFEQMEVGHQRKLEALRAKGPSSVEGENPSAVSQSPLQTPLETDHYVVPAKPTATMNFQEIITLGIAREEKSRTLYRRLLELTEDPQLRETFTLLAAEEDKHRAFFQEIYDTQIRRDN